MESPHNQPQCSSQPNLIRLQNLPRAIKKQHRLKIDVSKTEYPLIKAIAHGELGWKVWTRQDSKEEVNLFWIDTYVHDEFIRKMKPYQRVNHILGSQHLGKKNQLSHNINRMRKIMPKQYNFYPNTFNFPAQLEDYEKFAKNNELSYYIVKPCSDSQGRGIYLTKQPDTNSKEQLVVQEYIEKPLLIQNNKFDLRIYVLLKSISPLKIYVYQEGLCRLATSPYEQPHPNNHKNMNMHLTNYAINKLSPNFIFNKSEYEDGIGHKRSLSATFKTLQKMGYNIELLKLQIDKIIVKTILAVQPLLLKKYKQVKQTRQQTENTCFEILGFDILVKQDGQPLLLQVNHSPSFCTQTPLDLLIKKCLILDTLNLLNLNFEDKITYIKSRNQQDNISNHQIFRSYPKNVVLNSDPESTGGYRKIYPLDHPEHSQLSKLYESIIKQSKHQKIARITFPKHMPESLLNRPHFQHLNSGLDAQLKSEIDDIIFKNNKQKTTRSLSLYHVINNLKRTKLTELKNVLQYGQICNPISFIPEPSIKLNLDNISEQYNPEQSNSLIRNEEVTLYQKRIKNMEAQKKKYIKPLPIANVNIRLDEKYSHKIKEDKNVSHVINDVDGNYKIHSFINTSYLGERRKHKQEGLRTASNGTRDDTKSLQQKFRMTQRSHRLNSYSIQLKQKIERMQLARIRIQKHKKIDKSNFMFIKTHFHQQKITNPSSYV